MRGSRRARGSRYGAMLRPIAGMKSPNGVQYATIQMHADIDEASRPLPKLPGGATAAGAAHEADAELHAEADSLRDVRDVLRPVGVRRQAKR